MLIFKEILTEGMVGKEENEKGEIEGYRHEKDKRKNVVPARFASYDTSKPKPKKYEYDPYLDPQLVWARKIYRLFLQRLRYELHY